MIVLNNCLKHTFASTFRMHQGENVRSDGQMTLIPAPSLRFTRAIALRGCAGIWKRPRLIWW